MGVEPPGVSIGVDWPGVADGVMLGVMLGVMPSDGVIEDDGVALEGVSSQRDRRLLAPGVADSMTPSPWVRSALGVSAQPLLCPGVSVGANE